jgi:serine/threonine protein kinase
MALTTGTRLGPYEIVAAVGAGGMGEVYRARDTRLGRDVAIKVLPQEIAGDADRLRRFEQEARAAAALNHPNILALYDVGAEGGISYIVTELLEGRSLGQVLRNERLTVSRVVELSAGRRRSRMARAEPRPPDVSPRISSSRRKDEDPDSAQGTVADPGAASARPRDVNGLPVLARPVT